MKLLVLGNGFIGNLVNNYFGDSSVISEARIASTKDVINEIKKYTPDIVVNCIGRTGTPNIDWCESHKEETLFANSVVPLLIHEACRLTNKKMVHMSSGCIYEGGPWPEDATPNFVKSFYSTTKWVAETALTDFPVLQLRIRMPIFSINHDRNLLTKILRYDKLINEYNSITILDDFLRVMKQLLEMNQTGIFNVVNESAILHQDIIEIYNTYAKVPVNPTYISAEEFEGMVKAPRSNCTLSTGKLRELGIKVGNIYSGLHRTIKEYVKQDNEALCEA